MSQDDPAAVTRIKTHALMMTYTLQAPGLAFSLPREYSDRPHLDGRAIVELTVEKVDGSLSFVDEKVGGLSSKAQVSKVSSIQDKLAKSMSSSSMCEHCCLSAEQKSCGGCPGSGW